MRQAMKLGFLGAILALVAAFGVLAGSGLVSAQVAKTCTGNGPGGTLGPGGTATCAITLTTALPVGGELDVQTTSPAGSVVATCATAVAGAVAIPIGNDCSVLNNGAGAIPQPAGTLIATETITIPAGAAPGTHIIETATICSGISGFGGAAGCTTAGNAVLATGSVTATGVGSVVSVVATTIPTLTAANFTKTCAPGNPATAPVAYPIATTCTISVTVPAPGFPAGVTAVSDTITSTNAVFGCNNSVTDQGVLAPGTCGQLFTGSICTNGTGVATVLGQTTFSCQLPTITVSGATALSECVTVGIVGDATSNQTVCGVAPPAGTFGAPAVPVGGQATSATLTCNGNTANIGGTLTLTSLTGGAQACTVNVSCLAGGVAATKCADGNVSVDLQGISETGIISCDGASNAAALQACSANTNGTSLNIPCGSTAPNGAVVSATCQSVTFNVQSALAACLANPINGCGGNLNSQNGCVSILLDYEATEGNGGSSQNFGTFSVCFPAASLGALVVSCVPNIIPSNGTLASVCTATFASTGLTFSTAAGTLPVVTNVGTSATAAFLPGTFTITSPGEAILDNGRQSETIPCGVASNVTGFGVGSFGNNGFNAIGPVTFSCTGVSFLAIGNGAAGDAPINVTYQSAVGGFQAVGSALLTAVPAGSPKISISCTNGNSVGPSNTIVAGGAGAFCFAQVTDQNGVPLTGITGAGVTFTVSNPAAATIIPCGTSVTVTSGLGVGSCVPLTGGLIASSPTLGQVVTIPTGFSSAEVVASATATPQTITVTASLGVFVPPQFLCFLGQGTVTSSLGIVSLPTNCGTSIGLGSTGFTTALNPASLGFGGTIALPNATSASTTLQIIGSATVTIQGSPQSLSSGCNQVIVSTAAGTQVSKIAATVTPASAVISIWRFNNSTKTFNAGFFSDPNAPTDFNTTAGGTETYFVCLGAAGTAASA